MNGWLWEVTKQPCLYDLQIVGEFKGVSAGAVFDTVLDGEYRSTWDENVIEDYEICRLDDCNDIGYYSSKLVGRES